MSDVLSSIRVQMLRNRSNDSCSTNNCSVDMTDVTSNRIVVNVDRVFQVYGEIGKHCDRFLFYVDTEKNSLVVVLIELKGGTFKAADVAAQLQGGADFVKRFIPAGIKTICVPILFHGNGNHKAQFKKLRYFKVGLTQKHPIVLGKCGATKNLASLLPK